MNLQPIQPGEVAFKSLPRYILTVGFQFPMLYSCLCYAFTVSFSIELQIKHYTVIRNRTFYSEMG